MKARGERDLIYFEGMTLAALDQEDGAAFIKCLLRREKVCERLTASSSGLDTETAERLCATEMKVIERLEEQRSKLLAEIDRYSQKRRALRSYAPRFPLPPLFPLFSVKK